jgi:hypothetical protein
MAAWVLRHHRFIIIIIVLVLLIVTLDTFPIILNPIPNLLHLRIPLGIFLNPLLHACPICFIYDQQTAPDHPKFEGGIRISDQRNFLAEGAEDRDESVSRQTAGQRRGCRRVVVGVGRDREEFGDAFAQLVRSNGFAVCFESVDGLRGDLIVDLKKVYLLLTSQIVFASRCG